MFPLIDFRHNITVQQEPQASANNGGQPSSPSMTRLRAIARKSYPSMSMSRDAFPPSTSKKLLKTKNEELSYCWHAF